MGINCGAPGCESKGSETKMHVLPSDNRFKIWATFIGRPDLDISKRRSYRICDKHFPEEMKYVTSFHNVTNLKKSALPVNKENSQNAVPVDEEDGRLLDDCDSESINLTSDISDNTQQNVIQEDIIQQVSACTSTKNLSNTCIVCLKDDVQMETLSSLSVLSEFKELFKYLRIEEFSNVIALNSVCSNCVLQMHNMLSFKRQCEESKEKLGLFLPIPEIVQSSADVEHVFDKATQTEIEEIIDSKTLEETSAEVEEELDNITNVEEELENITPSDNEQNVNSETEEEKCVNCNEKFKDKSLLRRHQILIHGLKKCIQECHYCIQLYTIKSYKIKLKIHNENHHENICIICDHKFETIFHLAKHRVLHTLSDNKDCRSLSHKNRHNVHQPCGKVACAQCGKFYSSVQTLRGHILRMHYQSKKVKQSNKVNQSNKVKVPCTMCTRSVYNLNEHLKRHQTHKFQQRSSVPQKSRIQTKDELCPYCGKLYTRSSLRGHIATVHLKIKNYECGYCNKMFSTANLRTNHLKAVHLKLKRFQCNYCDEKFISRAHLKCHMFKHTQVKTIKCRFCDKLLCGNLKRHLENVHKMVLL